MASLDISESNVARCAYACICHAWACVCTLNSSRLWFMLICRVLSMGAYMRVCAYYMLSQLSAKRGSHDSQRVYVDARARACCCIMEDGGSASGQARGASEQ
eukprot:6196564-Pleurochrysis_carterae.AAC.2